MAPYLMYNFGSSQFDKRRTGCQYGCAKTIFKLKIVSILTKHVNYLRIVFIRSRLYLNLISKGFEIYIEFLRVKGS